MYPTMPPPSEEVSLVIADGDEFGDGACLALAAACGCPVLVFGREERTVPAEGGIFLRRPFALAALEKAVIRLLPSTLYAQVAPIAPEATTIPEPPLKPTLPPPPTPVVRDGVVTVGQHTVTLTPAEETILVYLLAREGQTVTREELSALLEGGGNIVDVYVCRLRAKIEKPLGRRMIRTVRGVGYVMEG